MKDKMISYIKNFVLLVCVGLLFFQCNYLFGSNMNENFKIHPSILIEQEEFRGEFVGDDLLIWQKLEQEDKDFFSSRSMRIDLLKNCPQVIPVLVQWVYEEWHSYDSSLTKEKLTQSFHKRLNDDKIPLTFIVLKEDKPIGMISLKERPHDFLDFPEDSLWMGSLHVNLEERNQGLGRELLRFASTVAGSFGYEKMHFYTSNFDNVRWYLNNGAYIVQKRFFRGHPITIMKISVK